MKPRHKRGAIILVGLVGVGAIAALVLNALQSNINLFFSPSQVAAHEAPRDHTFRLGGLVKEGTVHRAADGVTVQFDVTDNAQTVKVAYVGILPDLFKEGQGVVAQGKLGPDGVFKADEVLAKHDETYMPPEVAKALDQAKMAKSLKE